MARSKHNAAAYALLLAATLFAGAQASIYPADHWQHSTKLSTANADDFVKSNVEAGKTVFIRFIASEG